MSEENEVTGLSSNKLPKMHEPVKLRAEDRLMVENLHLRQQNLAYAVQVYQEKIQGLEIQRAAVEKEMGDFRQKLEEEYGIDLSTHQIMKDGAVIPRADKMQTLQQLLENVPPIEK